MSDLQILSMLVDGLPQTVAVATGRSPLAVINPQTGQLLWNGAIATSAGTVLTQGGLAIGAATIDNVPLALVSALPPAGSAGAHRFVVVDLTNPRGPVARGYIDLPGSAYGVQDIVVRGTTAFVGTDSGSYLVDISDAAHPRLTGTLSGLAGSWHSRMTGCYLERFGRRCSNSTRSVVSAVARSEGRS